MVTSRAISIPVRGGMPYRLDPTPDSLLNSVDFIVPGQAYPQGSKSPKGRTRTGRIVMVESSREVGPWRERVALAAGRAMGDAPLLDPPVAVDLEFILPRLKSGPKYKTHPMITAPDIDKLARAILDAITGVIIGDDAHVTRLVAHKRRAEPNEPVATRIAVWGLV